MLEAVVLWTMPTSQNREYEALAYGRIPAMRSASIFALLIALSFLALQGCEAPVRPCVESHDASGQQLATLKREREDTLFEIQLRQDELDRMMTSVKGAVGVSSQWLERKAQLTEKITQLQVNAHDLDLQISHLSTGGTS